MDANYRRIHPRESAFLGGFIALSIIPASCGKLDRFVNLAAAR